MLQDHRGTYIRLEDRGFRQEAPAALKATVIWVIAITAFAALLFASLKFGGLGGVEALSFLPTPGM